MPETKTRKQNVISKDTKYILLSDKHNPDHPVFYLEKEILFQVRVYLMMNFTRRDRALFNSLITIYHRFIQKVIDPRFQGQHKDTPKLGPHTYPPRYYITSSCSRIRAVHTCSET